MSQNQTKYWEEHFKVNSFCIGPDHKLTVPHLLNFMQETAGQHAHAKNSGFDSMMENGKVWVLSRIKLLIDKLPSWGDNITLRTWVSRIHSSFSHREFSILNEEGKEVVCATTLWVLIDLETRRPVQIGDLGEGMPVWEGEETCAGTPVKVPKLEHSDNVAIFPVRYSELDILRHVNNTKYVTWVLDVFQPAFHFAHKLVELDVNFIAETNFGDEVSILTEPHENNSAFLHVVRKSDGTDSCRLRTVWKEI